MSTANPLRTSRYSQRSLTDFRPFVKESTPGHCTLNFKDPSALRTLTYALLEQDFGLNLSIPLDRLIPTVPLRLNYVLCRIEDLLPCIPEVRCHATVGGFDVGEPFDSSSFVVFTPKSTLEV